MKVVITLDRYDGSKGKSREIDLENFPSRQMVMMMLESDVCGFTVTKLPSIKKLIQKLGES